MTSRTGELFPPKPRRPWRRLMTVEDAGDVDEEQRSARGRPTVLHHVRLGCRCGYDDGWSWRATMELRRGVACPKCNPRNPQDRPLT